MGHRPSAIAAASVLLALDDRLTGRALELKMNSISQIPLLEIVSSSHKPIFSHID